MMMTLAAIKAAWGFPSHKATVAFIREHKLAEVMKNQTAYYDVSAAPMPNGVKGHIPYHVALEKASEHMAAFARAVMLGHVKESKMGTARYIEIESLTAWLAEMEVLR